MGSPVALRDGKGDLFPALSVGILVYLATITMVTMLLVKEIGSRCFEETHGRMMMQLPAVNDEASSSQRAGVVLARVQGLPEAHVELVREGPLVIQELPRLSLMPLLAAPLLSPMLPLELKPATRDAASVVRDRLRREIDDVQIVLGMAQLEQARQVMMAVNELALLVQYVLIAALCASVLLSTLAQLEASDESVELIHLLGADDAAIIKMVVCAALRAALTGGFAGSAMAMFTFIMLVPITSLSVVQIMQISSLSAAAWLTVFVLPGAAVCSAMFAAWIAARRALASMP